MDYSQGFRGRDRGHQVAAEVAASAARQWVGAVFEPIHQLQGEAKSVVNQREYLIFAGTFAKRLDGSFVLGSPSQLAHTFVCHVSSNGHLFQL
jgi:hypothetical protein